MIELSDHEFELMGIPFQFWDMRWDRVRPGTNKERVEAFLRARFKDDKDIGLGLLLMGSCGVGKSMFSAIVASAYRHHDHSVTWVSAVTAQRLLATDVEYEEGVTWEEHLREAEVVVIDDLGAEGSFARWGNHVLSLMSDRINNGQTLVLNTRFDGAQLNALYGVDWLEGMMARMVCIRLTSEQRNEAILDRQRVIGGGNGH